jgi:dihydroorotase-like cyclic amidohydrolase
MNQTWTVKKEDLFSKCGWSAYEEMQLVGRPIATYLRGEKVYENGRILTDPQGRWVNH